MGIVRKQLSDIDTLNKMQQTVLNKLMEYDYDIADLRHVEELDQLVITLPGIVIFVDPNSMSISFEIGKTPDFVSNFILVLTEVISPKRIHVTDSFTIAEDIKGKKIAVFGDDAVEIYKQDMAYKNTKYYRILTSPDVKFYNC